MKTSIRIALVILIIGIINIKIKACTIFCINDSINVIVGNNEDNVPDFITKSYMWFIPASKGKYGRVYFGYSDLHPQGGMNEHGLFFDGVSAPYLEIKDSKNKISPHYNLSEKLLEECRTVEEALEMFDKYYLKYFEKGAFLIADKTGASIVIEGDSIIYKKGNYQVQTNFYQSNPSLGGYPCHRFDIAENMLSNCEILTIPFVRSVLRAVHSEGGTVYSNIYDLRNTSIYLFHNSDFNNYLKFNLQEELKKGTKYYKISDIFLDNQLYMPDEDNPSGELTSFYNNGTIKCKINLANSKLIGTATGWLKNGNKNWETVYSKNSILNSIRYYSNEPSGNIEYLYNEKGTLLEQKGYYNDTSLFSRIIYKNGIQNRVIVWDENGKKVYEFEIRNGLLFQPGDSIPYSGILNIIFSNGQKHFEVIVENGIIKSENIQDRNIEQDNQHIFGYKLKFWIFFCSIIIIPIIIFIKRRRKFLLLRQNKG